VDQLQLMAELPKPAENQSILLVQVQCGSEHQEAQERAEMRISRSWVSAPKRQM